MEEKTFYLCVCVCGGGGGGVVTWDLLPIVLYTYKMTEHHMNNDTKNCIKQYYPVPTKREIFFALVFLLNTLRWYSLSD